MNSKFFHRHAATINPTPIMKIRALVVFLMTFALVAGAQNPDLEQLQNTVKALQQMVTNLQQEVIELKKQQAAPAATNAIAVQEKGAVEFIPPTIKTPPKASEVTARDTLNDYQEAAQRPGSLTLDPKYKGFIPIPNTPAFIKFNAKVRVDSTFDNQNSGNNDRFTPALIPVESQANRGGGSHFNVNSRGSSLSVDVRAPDLPGDPRFYYNNDFYGGGVNDGMGYRLKHLYGQ